MLVSASGLLEKSRIGRKIIFGVNIISGDQETPHAAEAITTVNPFVREPFTPFIVAAQPLTEVTQLE